MYQYSSLRFESYYSRARRAYQNCARSVPLQLMRNHYLKEKQSHKCYNFCKITFRAASKGRREDTLVYMNKSFYKVVHMSARQLHLKPLRTEVAKIADVPSMAWTAVGVRRFVGYDVHAAVRVVDQCAVSSKAVICGDFVMSADPRWIAV